ncbi:tetratricopeptide repeat protein [Vulcaniibacterium gelatinicum]|uniref:tetratricopeptide repeat protein n=1 Tax=Vulcaniibacterium gelatinicum TaxID=2598725 RepID=UPI0011CB9B59|nr:hypothetical protein [Vulcaniibacterium gelatinicum]
MQDAFAELDTDTLHERAYEAFDHGRLHEASRLFAALLARAPDEATYHYMRGLAHKYLRDWPVSLQHNLRALALHEEPDEAALWNAGIAATALGDWPTARRQWAACGIRLPEGEGPVEGDFGIVSIRLNPWSHGETLFARRIDVVRARLLNVPLPESGYRHGDIVLHDGARTGERRCGDRTVPVFNALERLARSEFQTFTVFLACDAPEDLASLLEARVPGIAEIEDWTDTVVHYCLRCSYGAPHRHASAAEAGRIGAWRAERNLGIAAQGRASVMRLLERWKGRGRRVDGVELREADIPQPEDGHVWWRGPEDED